MAVDAELNDRLRAALDGIPCISEKSMMGATCFFHHGNMLGGADRAKAGERRFLFRVGPDGAAEALSRPGARPAELGARTMRGLVFVDADACDPDALRGWVDLAMDFVWTLAPKDLAPKDLAPKDLAPKDLAPEDLAPEDLAPKDLAPKDLAPKDLAPKDLAPEDLAPKL